MGKRINVPGQGIVEFPDSMSDDEIVAAIQKLGDLGPAIAAAGGGGGPSPSRQGNYDYTPEPPAFDPKDPLKRLRTGGIKAVLPPMKQEDKPVGTPLEIADDVVRQAADTITFGLTDKAVAAGKSLLGDGTYDENLEKERRETENAGQRLGVPARIAANVGGGVLGGSGLARMGLTYLGRLPATAPLVSKIFRGGVEGAAYGAAHGAGHTDSGDWRDYVRNTWEQAKVGGLLGAAVPAVVGSVQKTVTPFHNPDPVHAAQARTLRNAGLDLSAGQTTNSRIMRWFEDMSGKMPFGSDPTGLQLRRLTQNVMEDSGIPGARAQDLRATPPVLRAADQRVGGNIGNIQRQYPVDIDPPVLSRAQQILADDVPVLEGGSQGRAIVFLNRLVNGDIRNNVAALNLSPNEASRLRTQLNRAINAQTGKGADTEYRAVLLDIRNTLDEALERAIARAGNPADVQRLQELRQQYANLQVLHDAIGRSGAQGARGELTPTALSSALSSSVGKKAYVTGRGDLNERAQAASALLRPPPDSGTQTRANLTDPAKVAVGWIPSHPRAQAYLGNQITAPPSGGILQPGVTGASAVSGQLGPADRIIQGLLQMGGR